MNSLPPWRLSLVGALDRNRSLVYSRYLQLATIRLDHRPANRTVVFRGFLEQTNQLKFITDSRSQKIEQIEQNNWAEACWYFPQTREQFRLLGQLKVISESDIPLKIARQATWNELSEAAKSQFYWPTSRQPKSDSTAFLPLEIIPLEPPPNFCLLLLDPQEVDHLELKGEPQNRTIYVYHSEQGWLQEVVNP